MKFIIKKENIIKKERYFQNKKEIIYKLYITFYILLYIPLYITFMYFIYYKR